MRFRSLWTRPGREAVEGKRYANHFDALMDARILDRIAATAGPLQSLTDAEACRWAERTIGIRFTAAGRESCAWVWSSVVTQRHSPT